MLYEKLAERIEALQINLSGRTVLTEAANGAYAVTPIIAALAGARVYAFGKETKYGTVPEIFSMLEKLVKECPKPDLDVTLTDKLDKNIIQQADIITNSGHLRPLNESILKHAKDGVVIPLMYEAWEWRDADVDINYVRSRGFRIGGTNERHPDVDVFNYLGDMAIKLILQSGSCLYNKKFVLICNNDFGPYIARTISKVVKQLGVIDKPENRSRYAGLDIEWLGDFPLVSVSKPLQGTEAVLLSAYPFDQTWLSENGPISPKDIIEKFGNTKILRYAGDVDVQALRENGMEYFPLSVHSGHMGVLPSDIGDDPIINLQSGGLKVAELLLNNLTDYKGLPLVEYIK